MQPKTKVLSLLTQTVLFFLLSGQQTELIFEFCKQESQDMLVKCLTEDKQFDKNRPVTACIVYKALLQWRSFEAEKTNIFDRIIHTIRLSIEVVCIKQKYMI